MLFINRLYFVTPIIVSATLVLMRGVSATLYYSCPAVGSSIILHDLTYDPANPTNEISISKTLNVGDVCVLSLITPEAALQPVARSYDGRNWEVRAGPFAGLLDEPSCENGISCTFNIPTDRKTLGTNGEYKYTLTSYSHSTSRE